MAKYRKTIRIFCFIVLLVSLILRTFLLPNNKDFKTSIIYPFSLIFIWLVFDRHILKDDTKNIELINIKFKKRAQIIYWIIYIFSLLSLEIINYLYPVLKISFLFIPVAVIIGGAEFNKEIVTWIYRQLATSKSR